MVNEWEEREEGRTTEEELSGGFYRFVVAIV